MVYNPLISLQTGWNAWTTQLVTHTIGIESQMKSNGTDQPQCLHPLPRKKPHQFKTRLSRTYRRNPGKIKGLVQLQPKRSPDRNHRLQRSLVQLYLS